MSGVPPRLAALRGRRILVTGDTGFKGSWLVSLLEAAGARVQGYALAPETQPSLHLLLGRTAPPWGYADVRDRVSLAGAFSRWQPELVFHLAAQALVRRSYADPVGTFSTNVQGTANLLEEVRRCPSVRAVVVVTSDKCYRNDGRSPAFQEDDALGGADPYSASKAAAELVTASYRSSFFSRVDPPVGIATARAGNVLGGGDWSDDRLLPDIVRAVQSERPVLLRHPDAVRPWQHVLDVTWGYALLATALLDEPGSASRAWNFAPAEERAMPVCEVAEMALAAFASDQGWRRLEEPSVPEAPVLRLDATPARQLLGWRCRLSAEEAVRWTVEWQRGLTGGASAVQLVRAQLEAHLARTGVAEGPE